MDHSNRKSRILATGLIAISMATNTSTNAFSSITALLSARRTISISNHHHSFNIRSIHFRRKSSQLVLNAFHDDYGQDDEDEDLIDVNSLGDWRTFRRHLLVQDEPVSVTQSRASPENLDVLRSQNPELAKEYHTGVWAHETSTPEVGGLVVRMPLEVELHRNHKHSLTGRRLHELTRSSNGSCSSGNNNHNKITDASYEVARRFVADEMMEIAKMAAGGGQVMDANSLTDQAAELLQLYLDQQETWQEVCLVLEHDKKDEQQQQQQQSSTSSSSTLVLNRPMALKLTENLAQLLLYGAGRQPERQDDNHDDASSSSSLFTASASSDLVMVKFLLAFGNECAVFIGGPDGQDKPAELIHGFADLAGATEIAPGTGIYRGGLPAAIDGVLRGDYRALDFRFFFGRYVYEDSMLDVNVVLGKYQPVACARVLPLKQCLSLPKPLWHEVLEICGGEMRKISELELLRRDDDLQFEIIDEDEFDELGSFDDEDDDDDFYYRI